MKPVKEVGHSPPLPTPRDEISDEALLTKQICHKANMPHFLVQREGGEKEKKRNINK